MCFQACRGHPVTMRGACCDRFIEAVAGAYETGLAISFDGLFSGENAAPHLPSGLPVPAPPPLDLTWVRRPRDDGVRQTDCAASPTQSMASTYRRAENDGLQWLIPIDALEFNHERSIIGRCRITDSAVQQNGRSPSPNGTGFPPCWVPQMDVTDSPGKRFGKRHDRFTRREQVAGVHENARPFRQVGQGPPESQPDPGGGLPVLLPRLRTIPGMFRRRSVLTPSIRSSSASDVRSPPLVFSVHVPMCGAPRWMSHSSWRRL